MIRKAKHEDIDSMLEMADKFFLASGYSEITPIDVNSTRSTMIELIENETGILYVAEENGLVGMIGAILYPFYFNKSHITGQELFWWVNPECRKSNIGIELLDAVEKDAKKYGAQSFFMVALEKLTPDIVGNIYLKNGYRKSEHNYVKVI